jgi:hypothetical protein
MIAETGKLLMLVGGCLLVLGGLLWLGGGPLKHLPIGRLPGDIWIQNDGFSFYFPLTTGILISLLLSGLIWLLNQLVR